MSGGPLVAPALALPLMDARWASCGVAAAVHTLKSPQIQMETRMHAHALPLPYRYPTAAEERGLSTHYSPLTTHFPLPSSHHYPPLPTTLHPPPTTHPPLTATHYSLTTYHFTEERVVVATDTGELLLLEAGELKVRGRVVAAPSHGSGSTV